MKIGDKVQTPMGNGIITEIEKYHKVRYRVMLLEPYYKGKLSFYFFKKELQVIK